MAAFESGPKTPPCGLASAQSTSRSSQPGGDERVGVQEHDIVGRRCAQPLVGGDGNSRARPRCGSRRHAGGSRRIRRSGCVTGRVGAVVHDDQPERRRRARHQRRQASFDVLAGVVDAYDDVDVGQLGAAWSAPRGLRLSRAAARSNVRRTGARIDSERRFIRAGPAPWNDTGAATSRRANARLRLDCRGILRNRDCRPRCADRRPLRQGMWSLTVRAMRAATAQMMAAKVKTMKMASGRRGLAAESAMAGFM